jgi:F0F1-type ATP synthase beta subunit
MQVERQQNQQWFCESGERVRNAYATYLQLGNSPGKPGLIPHKMVEPHGSAIKVLRLEMGMRAIS